MMQSTQLDQVLSGTNHYQTCFLISFEFSLSIFEIVLDKQVTNKICKILPYMNLVDNDCHANSDKQNRLQLLNYYPKYV